MRGRLMVGREPLELHIWVRILAPQPKSKPFLEGLSEGGSGREPTHG
jgi:hypothetical protein